MSSSKLGIKADGLFEQRFRAYYGLQGKTMNMPYAALIALPRTQAFGRPATGDDLFGVVDFGNDGGRYGCCDLILDSKDITQLAVVALGPEMIALLRIDELDSNANLVTKATNAPFDNGSHSQLRPDLRDRETALLDDLRRGATDDPQVREAREHIGQLLAHAVGEVLLVTVSAQVVEGQDH